MLCLGRREGERIIIGEGPKAVVVEVQEVRGDRVTLAFHAPREVKIIREEIADR